MKKVVYFGLIIGLAALLVAGCSSSSSTTATKTLNDVSAKSYAEIGTTLAQDITGSMGSWASSGSVSGVTGLNAKGLRASSVDVTEEASGWTHITGEVTSVVTVGATAYTTTYSINLFGKVVTDEAGKVTSVSVYGSYSYSTSGGGSTIAYSETFGNGVAAPYVGTASYSGATLNGITCAGAIKFDIAVASAAEGSHTVAMTFTLTSFSVPIRAGLEDYPTGTITIATTYDGAAQPNIVLTFTGIATATITYGDYTSTFLVGAS